MPKKIWPLLLITILIGIGLINVIPLSFAASPTLVQTGYTFNTSYTASVTLTGVKSGNYILVGGMQEGDTNGLNAPTSPNVTLTKEITTVPLNSQAVWYLSGPVATNGSVSVTLTTVGSVTTYILGLIVYEVSGLSGVAIQTETNSQSSSCGCSVSSFYQGALTFVAVVISSSGNLAITYPSYYTATAFSGTSSSSDGGSAYSTSQGVLTTVPITSASASSWGEVVISFGPFSGTSTIVTTMSVTAWNVLNSSTSSAWVIAFLFLMIFPAFFWGFMRMFGRGMSNNLVFLTLIALTLGSLIGVIAGTGYGTTTIIPMGMTIVYGSALVLYIFKHRSRGGAVSE